MFYFPLGLSNKKLLGAPGLTTRNKKLLVDSFFLFRTKVHCLDHSQQTGLQSPCHLGRRWDRRHPVRLLESYQALHEVHLQILDV